MINSTCEKNHHARKQKYKNRDTDIKDEQGGETTTIPKRVMVFVTLRLSLSLSSISSITTSSLSSVSGLADNRLSTRSEPSVSISDSPYCKSSHGCFTCMENRLSRIKSTLSFPLLLESGSTILCQAITPSCLYQRKSH